MVSKVLKVLSYGRKIEKYARSAQAVAKAIKQVYDELKVIWEEEINTSQLEAVPSVTEENEKDV